MEAIHFINFADANPKPDVALHACRSGSRQPSRRAAGRTAGLDRRQRLSWPGRPTWVAPAVSMLPVRPQGKVLGTGNGDSGEVVCGGSFQDSEAGRGAPLEPPLPCSGCWAGSHGCGRANLRQHLGSTPALPVLLHW